MLGTAEERAEKADEILLFGGLGWGQLWGDRQNIKNLHVLIHMKGEHWGGQAGKGTQCWEGLYEELPLWTLSDHRDQRQTGPGTKQFGRRDSMHILPFLWPTTQHFAQNIFQGVSIHRVDSVICGLPPDYLLHWVYIFLGSHWIENQVIPGYSLCSLLTRRDLWSVFPSLGM